MKKIIITLAAALVSFGAFAQDAATEAAQDIANAAEVAPAKPKFSEYWTESLKTNITAGQTGLFNWAAGGDNTVSLAAYIDGNANYKKDAMFWNNRLQLDYGFLYASSKPILQKSTDRIYLESKWGYQIKDQLYFSANYDFKSQFTTGYAYNTPNATNIDNAHAGATSLDELTKKEARYAWKDARVGKSGFLSPAYTNLALGIDWKPKDWFSLSFAPLTGGYVIVANEDYRAAYSMKYKKDIRQALEDGTKTQAEIDAMGGSAYMSHRFEFGAQIKMDLKAQINENFTYTTQLVLFEDYIKDHKLYPAPRINWDNRIDWKIAKYFALTVTTNLIYDQMVKIATDKWTANYYEADGTTVSAWGQAHKQANAKGISAVQFKECVSFGFTYTIASKK